MGEGFWPRLDKKLPTIFRWLLVWIGLEGKYISTFRTNTSIVQFSPRQFEYILNKYICMYVYDELHKQNS